MAEGNATSTTDSVLRLADRNMYADKRKRRPPRSWESTTRSSTATQPGSARVTFPDRSSVVAFASIPKIGDHIRIEFRVVDANGRIRWIEEIATNLLDDPAVGSVVGNLRDITERVNLLERIELDRRRLADAQAAARLGSFELDLRTGDITRSDEMCRILGGPCPSAWE